MNLAICLAILVAVAWLISRSRRRRRGAVTPPATLNAPRQQSERRGEGGARGGQPGGRVVLSGTPIDAGLFYLGSALSTQRGYAIDKALVDPSLPVGRSPGNTLGE